MAFDLEAMITRPRTNDGWAAGYQDNFNRIYYVKRIHENALLVISFYTAELESVFDNPEIMKDMSIRLTDGNYNILYSSEADELGLPLSEDLVSRVADRKTNESCKNDGSFSCTFTYMYKLRQCSCDN